MKLMIDGIWRGDCVPPPALAAQRMIHAGRFRDRIAGDGVSGLPAVPGRYHLYVSHACPFSHRVILVRALKRLEHVVGLSVLHPVWDTPDGWVFGDTALSTVDGAGQGFQRLHEVYSAASPGYTGKVTVPVLWDSATRRIVNNESLEIAKMLDGAFAATAAPAGPELYPVDWRPKIDALVEAIERNLAHAVYQVAGAGDQRDYDAAVGRLFGFLNELEHRLGDGRAFLLGAQPTLADILAFATLVRFDAVYNPLFRATRKRVVDHPLLAAFVARVHDLPGAADTVRFDHILTHYYDGDWAVAVRRGIVPDAPAVDYRGARRPLRSEEGRSTGNAMPA